MNIWREAKHCFLLALFCFPLTCFGDSAEMQKGWCLKPVVRPQVPELKNNSGNPIDFFIDAELRKQNLTRSPAADRQTLLRRISFDLIGLPPTPEEAAAFLNNKNTDAYDELVEKLLGSPRYGERWARHWLDSVRFAESHGFEMNQPRANAWPYRDYVIRALNEDKPFDRFVIEQIAGDVFSVDEATGFLVGGPWDQVKSPDPILTANQRVEELHDIVSVTGSTFLGLTVGCARCHNHKFDPIPQKDYFAMKAVFEGVKHGERKLRSMDNESREQKLAAKRVRLAVIESELENFELLANSSETNAVRSPVNARKNVERFAPLAVKRLRFTIEKTSDAEPCLDEFEIYSAGKNSRNIALATNGTKASASSVYPNSEIHRLEHINDGRHGNGRSWISNERGKGWVELEFPETFIIEKVIWSRDRDQQFNDRLALDYKIEIATNANDWRVVASSSDRQKLGEKQIATRNSADPAQNLNLERISLEKRIAELANVPMVYAGTFDAQPEVTYLLYRGEATQKRDELKPNALSAVPVAFLMETNQSALTEDQRRRVTFAKWLVNPANPLTARVMVNRIWQHHFGEGLVRTPSDFGENGAKPTHPELLDWLASEFIENGWSVKHIHRLILKSETYRQSSKSRDDGIAVDANSKLLWRFPPRRLDAEAIRDSVLSVSGKLDLKMGGPGFSFFETNDNYVRVYEPRRDWPPETFRRMIYGTIIRQRTDGVLGVFDCPDAGQIAPKRNASTTPLQALNLLNSSFVVQQSGFFAERLEKELHGDVAAQIQRAFLLTFQRSPDQPEMAAAEKLIRSEGLTAFCRAMFNANEFIYIF